MSTATASGKDMAAYLARFNYEIVSPYEVWKACDRAAKSVSTEPETEFSSLQEELDRTTGICVRAAQPAGTAGRLCIGLRRSMISAWIFLASPTDSDEFLRSRNFSSIVWIGKFRRSFK